MIIIKVLSTLWQRVLFGTNLWLTGVLPNSKNLYAYADKNKPGKQYGLITNVFTITLKKMPDLSWTCSLILIGK